MLHECNNAVKVIQYTHILRIRTCTYVNMSIGILQYKYISLTEPQLPVDYLQHSLGDGPIPYARAIVTARACRIYLALRHLLYTFLRILHSGAAAKELPQRFPYHNYMTNHQTK